MPEPTTTTAAVVTLAATGVSIPMLTAFGIPLGLRSDVLIAGLLGSFVTIILLNSVPGDTDTWQKLLRTTLRRVFVAMASALTAGYLTPLVLLMSNVPAPLFLGAAFAVGGGAQRVLASIIEKFSDLRASASSPPPAGGA